MQKVHYDLDKVERDIRAMFSDQDAMRRRDGKPLDVVNQWQNKSCDLLVAFMRWQLEMEMAGVEPEMHARIVGVALGELAQQVFSGFDHQETQMHIAALILQGFCDHANQVMQRERQGVPSDLSMPLNPVVSGNA